MTERLYWKIIAVVMTVLFLASMVAVIAALLHEDWIIMYAAPVVLACASFMAASALVGLIHGVWSKP